MLTKLAAGAMLVAQVAATEDEAEGAYGSRNGVIWGMTAGAIFIFVLLLLFYEAHHKQAAIDAAKAERKTIREAAKAAAEQA